MASSSFFFLFIFLVFVITCYALVPASETFKYVNDGELRDFSNEYDATYHTTLIGAHPFQLMFYNTTPDSFILAYRMGALSSGTSQFWVWEANRGRPVREGGTLTFGSDGDLVLADADGTVVWSTGTANKGVVALNELNNGNLVLVDAKKKTVWQSFDHITDTLLVDQPLLPGGKLVSRKSVFEDKNGIYSFVLENNGFTFYASGVPYGKIPLSGKPTKASLVCTRMSATRFQLKLMTSAGTVSLGETKNDCRYSFLRLGIDGNLVANTYDDNADADAWQQTFSFFPDSGCGSPGKCGALGVCNNGKCESCPTSTGLVGWSSNCGLPSRGGCRPGGVGVGYFKVAGVEHFVTKFGKSEGVVSLTECRKRCSLDCNCLGFFYWEEASKCWLTPVIGTLSKVAVATHVAYIKSS